MYSVDAITFATRCAWHGAQQITTPVELLVRDARNSTHLAEYIDGSMATHGAARYRIAGAVYQLRPNGTLAAVEQARKAA